MVEYKILGTGSSGNALIYEKNILVDAGVSYRLLVDEIKNIKVILYTHLHQDHFKLSVLKRLAKENPDVVIMCGKWFKSSLEGLQMAHKLKIVYCEFDKWYKVGDIQVYMIKAYHDIDNCGWRINVNGKKIFHMTDTVKMEGIVAKGMDLYGVEFHHDTMIIEKQIEDKLNAGVFCYEIGAKNSHLSFQDAQKWINENKSEHSQVIKLHYSNCYELVNGNLQLKENENEIQRI